MGKGVVPRVHAVVLNTLARTQFGRRVRAALRLGHPAVFLHGRWEVFPQKGAYSARPGRMARREIVPSEHFHRHATFLCSCGSRMTQPLGDCISKGGLTGVRLARCLAAMIPILRNTNRRRDAAREAAGPP